MREGNRRKSRLCKLGPQTQLREHRTAVGGQRLFDRLMIQVANGAVRFRRVSVVMPNAAQRQGND